MTERERLLLAALRSFVSIVNEAWQEWDADHDMRAGKMLLAMAGHRPGYRADVDKIHAAIRDACDSCDPSFGCFNGGAPCRKE